MAEQHGGFESIAAVPVDTVKEALNRTMVMGLPVTKADRPTFYFDRDVTWTDHDSEDQPWDWDAVPVTDTTQAAVQPICAVEFFSPLGRQGGVNTEVGEFNPTTVVFTFMDDQYAKIIGFSYATVGISTQKWFFRFWRPSVGLGGMTVYQVHGVAEGID